LRDLPQACTMTAMKLSRDPDPLIHPIAVGIRPRFPAEMAARLRAFVRRDWSHARLHAAVERFFDKYERAFELA